MKKLLLLPLLLISKLAFSQADTSVVKLSNPPSVSNPKGYSQFAIINLGNSKMLILSGQVAFDKSGILVGKDDLSKQTDQVFLNIKSIVESAGGTMDNVVKLGYFLRDVSQVQAVRQVRDKYVNLKSPPASTLVEVSKLFRDDVLIEIEATAVIPLKKPKL